MQAVCAAVISNWRGDHEPEARPVLGVPVGAYLQQSTALEFFDRQMSALGQAGYAIKRLPMFDDIAAIDGLHQDMIAAELALQHREWFAEYSPLYRPRTAALIRHGKSVSPGRLRAAREHRLEFRGRLHQVMEAEGVEPLGLSVSARYRATRPGSNWQPGAEYALDACRPSRPVAAGRTRRGLGLPLGLQLAGRYGEDEKLLAWSSGIECLLPH